MSEHKGPSGLFRRRADAVDVIQGLVALVGYTLGATILLVVMCLVGGAIFE